MTVWTHEGNFSSGNCGDVEYYHKFSMRTHGGEFHYKLALIGYQNTAMRSLSCFVAGYMMSRYNTYTAAA